MIKHGDKETTASQQADEELKHGDDPFREFRASVNGKELIKDEYFEPVTLADFMKSQKQLEKLILKHGSDISKKIVQKRYDKKEVEKTKQELREAGFLK